MCLEARKNEVAQSTLDRYHYRLKQFIRWRNEIKGVDNRPDSRDDSGRKPLLTSRYGRLSRTNVRETVYRGTRPCYYGVECPRGCDPDICEGTDYDSYSKCPVNVSPHEFVVDVSRDSFRKTCPLGGL